jgi:hypothetical protein
MRNSKMAGCPVHLCLCPCRNPVGSYRRDRSAGNLSHCRTAAHDSGLPVDILTRLIWAESRFQAGVVSPAGAQGIAQFMPGTAAVRGLLDPYDPEQAIPHAASLLVDLEQQFGNIGLALAAYNAGSARVSNWLAGTGSLPAQTQGYVRAARVFDDLSRNKPIKHLPHRHRMMLGQDLTCGLDQCRGLAVSAHGASSHASTRSSRPVLRRQVRRTPVCVSMVAASSASMTSRSPSSSHSSPAQSMRAKGASRSQPNRSNGPQLNAAATAQNGLSRNAPTSSINRTHRFGGTQAGGLSGSSRAKPSAQARGILPSC